MVFSSMTFLSLALPLALGLYYLMPRGWRELKNAWLLAFSLVFYAWGEPVYVLLMLASIALNWGFALLFERFNQDARCETHKKWLMALCVVLNLGALVVFKYSALLVSSVNWLLGLSLPVPQILLPIGISFFTFQAMSYAIDVYRHDTPAQPRIDKVALYISLFPQLIAGPIVRYVDVADQIDRRSETLAGFASGMQRFVAGLGKKVLLANSLAPLADEAFALAANGLGLSAGAAWLGLICYALQIYFDFSGYSDMAIGLGRMFGFEFMENFNMPYIAASIREFWTRWHISLSTWFRDYLYIPLGGNRVKRKSRHIFNIAVVFLATGLWHGASWSFLLWGAYHGAFRILEEFAPALKRAPSRTASRIVCTVGTLLVVLMGWVLFRADTLDIAANYYRALFGCGTMMLTTATPLALFALPVGALCCIPALRRIPLHGALRWTLLMILLVLCMGALASEAYNPFIYFRF